MTTSTAAIGESPARAARHASSRVLNGALWTVQVLLAVAFGVAGFIKVTQPYEALAAAMPWVSYTPAMLVRVIGISELAGGIGLVLPALTRIRPILTPLAAIGLVIIMVLAAGVHAMHRELAAVPVNLVLGSLAAFVAWGRLIKAPIAARG